MKKTFYVEPVPASRARVTRWSTYFPKRYTEFKKTMEVATSDVQFIPSKEKLYVQCKFYVAIPKSWSKKKRQQKHEKFCDNNSDIDNYIKALLDSLEGIYYENDKQIVMIRAMKFYSLDPRIEYIQEEIDE